MVVDDEKDILRLIESYLDKRRIQHVGFSDPVDALTHFQQNSTKYDVVLSDIRMPHMSGLELAEHITALNPKVKILMMSAFVIDSNQMRRLRTEQKVADFVAKPFTFNMLGEVLDRHLGRDRNGISLAFL
jgi:DNA-binding NtrC family response regulator